MSSSPVAWVSKNLSIASLSLSSSTRIASVLSPVLDVVDGLVIGRVADPHEQFVATAPEMQGVVLADQFLADQPFGLDVLVQAVKVQQGHAEVLGGDLCHLTAFCLVLHQVTDQGKSVALGLLIRLLRALVCEQSGQHQLFGQTAEGDVIHWVTGYRQFKTYSLVNRWNQTSGLEVTKSVR